MSGGSSSVREVAEEYTAALGDLTFNSKPLINTLTMIAGENSMFCETIVSIIEHKMRTVPPAQKICFMYLTDSIVKNIGPPYVEVFGLGIVGSFCDVFFKVDGRTQGALLRLLNTWPPLFPGQVKEIQRILNERRPPSGPGAPRFVRRGGLVVDSRAARPSPPPGAHHSTWENGHRVPSQMHGVGAPGQPGYSRKRREEYGHPPPPRAQRPRFHHDVGQGVGHIGHTSSGLEAPPPLHGGANQREEVLARANADLYNLEQDLLVKLNNAIDAVARDELHRQLDHLNMLKRQAQALATHPPPMMDQHSYPSYSHAGSVHGEMERFGERYVGEGHLGGVHPDGRGSTPTTPLEPKELVKNLTQLGLLQPTTTTTTTTPTTTAHNNGGGTKSNTQLHAKIEAPTPAKVPIAKKQGGGGRGKKQGGSVPALVRSLYGDMKRQCTSCGLRFIDEDKHAAHLDWHFDLNKKEQEKSKKAISRTWFLSAEEWIRGDAAEDNTATPFFSLMDSEPEQKEEKLPSVVADDNHSKCAICGELFEKIWDKIMEQWVFPGAVRRPDEGDIVHVNCLS